MFFVQKELSFYHLFHFFMFLKFYELIDQSAHYQEKKVVVYQIFIEKLHKKNEKNSLVNIYTRLYKYVFK